MVQTIYQCPWPEWVSLAIRIPLAITWLVLIIVLGVSSDTTLAVGILHFVAQLFFILCDPETTITTRKALPDGTVVKVRRPLIGFKRYESPLGLTGGYEVRIDGYRYEPAYIRI